MCSLSSKSPLNERLWRLHGSASTTPWGNELFQFLYRQYIYREMCEWKRLAVIWTSTLGSRIEAHIFSIGRNELLGIGRGSWIAELTLEGTPTGRGMKTNCRKTAWRGEWDENSEEESGHSKWVKHLFFWHRDPQVTSLSYHLPPAHYIKLAWVPITPGIKA